MSLAYTTIGNGENRVLVFHGWFGDYSVWEPCFKTMDTANFTYVFIDYRGYGKSSSLSGNYSMSEIASDANELVKNLGWSKLHVIGHSMGGMAMQRFILDCDDSISILSAVGVTPVPACGGGLDDDAWTLFEGAITANENRYGILDFTTGNRLSTTWLNGMVAASREQTNEQAYAGYLNAWVKEDFASEVTGIKTPMMVCVGEHDGAINVDAMNGTYMSWIKNCKLEVISNAGHYPMQETPVYLITLVESFINENS